MAGFAESRGEIVVTLDADLQNPPEEIPKLVRKMETGFDVVAAPGTCGVIAYSEKRAPFDHKNNTAIHRSDDA